ncbi:MAG: DUF333 domain-containing protein [Anaerolineae bacterium]|nr:DUF333 domain-containing protein [Anaerolineae bacterium]
MLKQIRLVVSAMALAALALSACGQQQEEVIPPGDAIGLANPASVYCQGLGYREETREGEGGQYGVCIFSDGSECDTWDFLSGRCGQAHSYCVQQGYTLEMDDNVAICTFPDGSSCPEIDFFEDRCGPGEVDPMKLPEVATDALPIADVIAESSGVQVVGWMGYVVSAPEGSEYDDKVIILPEGVVGEFGIKSTDDAVEAQIVALRDAEQPGKYAHFWGTLTCGIQNVNDCQLLVGRMRVDGPGEFFVNDSIEGWEGTIVGVEPGEPGAPTIDDYFVLAGDYPVQYGIDSALADPGGERDLADEIAALRSNGQIVRIWGEMMCGVPDAGGCQIRVWKIEAGDAVYEIVPMSVTP